MAKEEKIYSKEEKVNYVILLHYRYKDDVEKCAKAMKLAPGELLEWLGQFIIDAKLLMIEYDKSILEGPVPTHQEIIEHGMRRLSFMVQRESDPAKIARAITAIADLEKGTGSGGKKREQSIFDKMNEKLIKKQGNAK